ncbi:MAG: helicase-exonuclease AddAB subunit AddA [Eubacteriales bacterium]|nr:helicase-exonuclease AddAB subunit AddA [Eubacteriales bacterium]
MGMKFTPDQQRVIDLRGCNILVSAAAGSGKTAVLVQRIVELVCDPVRETDIDQLLVVTFTNAAAAQMRERITKALTERSEAEPDNEHLKKQLTLIHNARITTIHSFCLYLIKNHFNEIGLDPDFRTADEGEVRLLQQDVLAEVLEEQFAAGREQFLACVEYFAYDGREKRLEELIGRLHEFAGSYPWPETWLGLHRKDYALESWEELAGTEWFGQLLTETSELLEECIAQTQESLQRCEEPDGPYFYGTALEGDRELLEGLARRADRAQKSGAMEDYEALQAAMSGLSFAALRAKKDDSVSAEKREQVKAQRQRVKDLTAALAEKYFAAAPRDWLAECRLADAALEELVELTLLYGQRLTEKKREKNLLDFSDMEHMALRILLRTDEDGRVSPTRTALEYREQFSEILIDEYQDSNLVQEYLLQSISGEDGGRFNRFMVGDVKQSIYKFRLARPELFMEKFDTYQKEGGSCVRVDLRRNFRSRRQVADCVNDLFLQIMHRSLGGVEYDGDAALYPAADFPEPQGQDDCPDGCPDGGTDDGQKGSPDPYEPELWVAATQESGQGARRQEARMVAGRIRELVGKLPVRDHETGQLRPASYRDIVILLRTTSGWDEDFKKVLEENGIPVFVTSKTGYFAATEVQTVLNFLRVLNNPLQEIPLFGVLRSPVGGFTDRELALLKASDDTGKGRLFDCMEKIAGEETPGDPELAEKCRDFLAFLSRFRELAVYLPIHRLMERFLEETGYLYTVSALPGGAQRRINVEMLLARAESFEKTSYSGLFHFVRYIEQLERFDIDYGETGASDENADVVRIMSIHKSKGLEFPVCIVAGLSKRFNRQDSAQPVLMDMDLGLALDWVDPAARVRRTTLKKNLLARKLASDSLGEELRVLYVALTRPEEKLILTASCKEDRLLKEQEQSGGGGSFSAVRLREAGSFYDLVLPAWQSCGRPVRVQEESGILREELACEAAEQNARQRLLTDPDPELGERELNALRERLCRPYPHENLSGLFVKTTVSELKKAGMREEAEEGRQLFAQEEVIPYLPRFVKEREEEISGTTRGSAYHRLLELFPFADGTEGKRWTADGVAEVIAQKRESRELSAEFARAVSPGRIAAFLESPLAGRMAKAARAGKLWREQPFVLGIPASRLDSAFPETETVLIQGIIDAFFEEEDGLVLLDYKTDAVSGPEQLVQRYRVQLDYYEQALNRLTGRRVKERLIYSFALGRELRL